jgi:hypothetical protein
LIEAIWKQESSHFTKGIPTSAYVLELTSVLERAAAFTFTGNAKVISKSLMRPLWMSQSLLELGAPTLNPRVLREGDFLATKEVAIREERWPLDKGRLYPTIASKYSHIFNYGMDHYAVSVIPLHKIYCKVGSNYPRYERFRDAGVS